MKKSKLVEKQGRKRQHQLQSINRQYRQQKNGRVLKRNINHYKKNPYKQPAALAIERKRSFISYIKALVAAMFLWVSQLMPRQTATQ